MKTIFCIAAVYICRSTAYIEFRSSEAMEESKRAIIRANADKTDKIVCVSEDCAEYKMYKGNHQNFKSALTVS